MASEGTGASPDKNNGEKLGIINQEKKLRREDEFG